MNDRLIKIACFIAIIVETAFGQLPPISVAEAMLAAPSNDLLQQAFANNDQNQFVPLERINLMRIKAHEAFYKKQIHRTQFYRKVFSFAGGFAAMGGIIWLIWQVKTSFNHKDDTPVSPTTTGKFDDALLKAAVLKWWEQQEEVFTLTGCIKRGTQNAFEQSANYFILFSIYGLFSYLWKNLGNQISPLLGKNIQAQAADSDSTIKKITQSFSGIIDEHAQVCECIIKQKQNDAITLAHKNFLEGEIQEQQAALIKFFEETLAFFNVVLQNNIKKSPGVGAAFEDQIVLFVDFVDHYTDGLEELLRFPDNEEKLTACRKMSLLSRQLFLRAAKFVQRCSELIVD